MQMRPYSRSATRRDAFTLPELMIGIATGSMVICVVGGLLAQQLRIFQWGESTMATRAQLRDASAVIAADLRGASVRGDTLRLLSDTAIEMFTMVGTSVTCDSSIGAKLALPPLRSDAAETLTGWYVLPDTGDVAVVLVQDGASPQPRWTRYRIASAASSGLAATCSTENAIAGGTAAGASAYVVTLRDVPSAKLPAGTPVRFMRRARYSLYRASDGGWYLGYRRCNALGGGCSAIQPVSGPYRGSAGSMGGLSLRYYDANGVEVGATSPLSVARVDITLRSDAATRRGLEARAMTGVDSVNVTVAMRNAS
jgi:hypothetical protein